MSIWNAERDQYISDNRLTMSSATIAKNLGNGITRKAVIGRAYRLNLVRLKLRTDPGRPLKQPKLNLHRTGPSKPPQIILPPAEPQPSLSIGFFDLANRQCKFPTSGEGHLTLFCGHVQKDNRPYCAGHCAIAYTSPRTGSPIHVYVGRKNSSKYFVLAGLAAA